MPSSQHQWEHIPLATIQRLKPGILRDRVDARMDQVNRQRKRIGRPKATGPKGLNNLLNEVWGLVSRQKAAKDLDVGYPAPSLAPESNRRLSVG